MVECIRYIRGKHKKHKDSGIQQSTELRKAMIDAWLVKQNIRYVAKVCRISRGVCDRYRQIDNWDEVTVKMMKRLKRKLATEGMNRTARNIRALDMAIENIKKQIKGKDGKKVPAIILHQLIKTQDELLRRNPEQDGQVELSDEVTEALKVLADMDKKEIRALGNLVVKEMVKAGNE